MFNSPFFHEVVFKFDLPVIEVMNELSAQGIVAGVLVGDHYPELENCLMLCATETKTEKDIDTLVDSISRIASTLDTTKRSIQPEMA